MSGAMVQTGELRIEYLPLSKIKRFDRNPKKHDVGALVTSIRRYGFRDAPIFDGTLGALVAGHGRLKALDELRKQKGEAPRGIQTGDKGEWLVPVQLGVDAASAAEAQAFLVDHNALTVAGGDMGVEGILRLYDQDGLGAMLKEMAEAGEMPVTLDGDDLDAILGTEKPALDAEPQIDRAAELQKKWGTARGQLWALGDHRLLCGDSTSREDVTAVMGGERAHLCLTDPPYGIGEDYASHTDTRDALELLVKGFLPVAREVSERVLLTPGNSNQWLYPRPDWTLCWFVSAGTGMNAWGFTCWQPVLAYGKDPYLATGKGSRPDALGKAEAAENKLGHPCSKPVGVWSWFMERGSVNRGDIVFEPFCGSGTTIIAAEQLGRKCRAIEIDPGYVAVTLQRWADATGKTPELLP